MIKKAVFGDAADIARLAQKMWSDSTLEDLVKDFENAVEQKQSAVFVLTEDNRAVGFAQCQLRNDYVEGTTGSPVGYLEGIYVEPDYRHRGFAKELLKKCEEWAKEKGCTEFASDCEPGNSESLNFHLKSGFSEANRIICFTKRI